MRIVPGNILHHADRTMNVPALTEALAIAPEIIYNVSNLYEEHETAFSSFLARKQLTASGLFADAKSPDWQVIGNRQFKWPLEGRSHRKGRIVSNNGAGETPGIGHTLVTLTVDTDWFTENETLQCWDARTILFVREKHKAGDGNWNYVIQLVSSDPSEFIQPALIAPGEELSSGYTMYPEASEDASERITHPEWHTEWLTIQRFKYSITGTANAHKLLIEHNGKYLMAEAQHIRTLRQVMRARENQLIFGRASIDATGNHVGVRDKWDREIVAGNGIIHQGDPSMKFTYNNMTLGWIENLLNHMQLSLTGTSSGTEIVFGGGLAFYTEFHRAMRGIFEMNPIVFSQGEGENKGVNATPFGYYQFNGMKLIPIWIKAFDDPMSAQKFDSWGQNYRSRMGFALNLGSTLGGGSPNVRLLALGNSEEDRRYVEREILGMTGGGVKNSKSNRMMVSSSVDAKEVHILMETGLALLNPLAFVEIIPAMRR